MHVSVSLEALLVVLFFILSTIFICVCTCNSESILNTFINFKTLICNSRPGKTKTAAPSTIYAYVPRDSYKRNWTPNLDEDTIVCARHSVPVWLQASSSIPMELYSSIYSFKNLHHQISGDSNLGRNVDTVVCYVSSV